MTRVGAGFEGFEGEGCFVWATTANGTVGSGRAAQPSEPTGLMPGRASRAALASRRLSPLRGPRTRQAATTPDVVRITQRLDQRPQRHCWPAPAGDTKSTATPPLRPTALHWIAQGTGHEFPPIAVWRTAQTDRAAGPAPLLSLAVVKFHAPFLISAMTARCLRVRVCARWRWIALNRSGENRFQVQFATDFAIAEISEGDSGRANCELSACAT